MRPGALEKAAIGTVVAIVLLEVGLRIAEATLQLRSPGAKALFALRRSTPYQSHPFVGYVLQPNHPRGPVNSQGLRGVELANPKPADSFRILCLGGSTTYGSDVTAEEAYPARLQAELGDRGDGSVRYEVGNCGVPGFTTAESLVNLQLRLLEYEPDAVIVYHAVNDARLLQSRFFAADYTHVKTAWKDLSSQIPPHQGWLIEHLHIYAWLSPSLGSVPKGPRLENLVYVDDYMERLHPFLSEVNQAGVDAYMRNVRNIVAVAQAHGVLPCLSTFATSRSRLDPADVSLGLCIDSINERLRTMARELELPLFEIDGALSDREELFVDYMHRSAEGCAEHAATIAEQAAEQALWGLTD